MDGTSMVPMLFESGSSKREIMFYYRGNRLMACRKGPWKAHFITQAGYRQKPRKQDPPLLFHLEHDPSEKYNAARSHPKPIADILKTVEEHRQSLKHVESQLDR